MAPASQEARESKRQRQRRRKAKLYALSVPSQPKPESVPLPSEPEESEDESSSDDENAYASITATERDLDSDESVWALYERWCLHHGINRTPEEMQRRFSIFKKSVIQVIKLNQKYNPGCWYCMFRWCDETTEERRQRMPSILF